MSTQTKPTKAHMALTFCIGLAFIGLVITGIVFLIMSIVNVFHAKNVYAEGVNIKTISGGRALDDALAAAEPDSESYFAALLENLVKQDLPAFKKVDELDSQYIISYGLWQTITLNGKEGILARDEESGQYHVPKDLVEKMARYYLPFTKRLEHQDVNLCGEFQYNRLNSTYTVPIEPPSSYLVPKIVEIRKNPEMDLVEVTVDCYLWDSMSDDGEFEPTENEENFRKRMVFTLSRTQNTDEVDLAVEGDHYTVISMQQTDRED